MKFSKKYGKTGSFPLWMTTQSLTKSSTYIDRVPLSKINVFKDENEKVIIPGHQDPDQLELVWILVP